MARKVKVSYEIKAQIVRQVFDENLSLAEAAKKAGVNVMVVKDWIRIYQNEGITGLLPRDKNNVYNATLKMSAVTDYVSGNGSLRDICQKYKIRSSKQLRNWLEVYNAHGDFHSVKYSGGGSYMTHGRDTTQEERIQISKDCIASGKNYGELALKYQVSYQQARTWTLRFEELGEAGLEDRRGQRKRNQKPRTELEQAQIEIEQLKHKLYLAEMENTLLKKLDEVERRSVSAK